MILVDENPSLPHGDNLPKPIHSSDMNPISNRPSPITKPSPTRTTHLTTSTHQALLSWLYPTPEKPDTTGIPPDTSTVNLRSRWIERRSQPRGLDVDSHVKIPCSSFICPSSPAVVELLAAVADVVLPSVSGTREGGGEGRGPSMCVDVLSLSLPPSHTLSRACGVVYMLFQAGKH